MPVSKPKKVVKTTKKLSAFSIPVYSITGKETGPLALPKEIFGTKVNKNLLSQAIRVYMTNQKDFTANTKTRGEVEGSTVKIYRQKGTGRARHGAIRAPIFVGGGIVFGPQPRNVRLNMPTRMKKVALFSALSSKLADKNIVGLSGIEKASGKTKEMFKLISIITQTQFSDKKKKRISALIVTAPKTDNVVLRGSRNIPGVTILPANLLNAYEILKHEMLLITKEAVETFLPKEEKGPVDLSSK